MDEPTVTALRTLAELRHRDPESVRARSAAVIEAAPPDATVRAAAEWVHGLALHELGHAGAAVAHYRAAVRDGDAVTTAAARASLAMSLLAVGDAAGARREIGLARRDPPAAALRYVEPLWAVHLQRTGRLDDALVVFDRVVPLLDREGDRPGLARTLLNRGTLLAYQGRFDRAVSDLARSESLAAELGHGLLSAMAAHNLGFTEGRRFAIPAGLAAFDRARAAYRAVGDPPRQVAVLVADHCELLLHAGLARDARAAALDALRPGAAEVDRSHETEIRLLLAQAHLHCGDAREAMAEAARAADGFRRDGRRPWVALARYVEIRAEVLATEEERLPDPALVRRARDVVRRLDDGGWPTEAAHARALLGRLATAAGDVRSARRQLASVAGLRGRGGVDVRTAGWHARALLRLADGDRSGAKRALRRGLALVEDHRAALTAAELRAGAAVQAHELARLGLRLALADGRPLEVLRWAERGRAGALRLPPIAPPSDDDLTAALIALHAERAAAGGGTRVAALEAEIKTRTLRSGGAGGGAAPGLDVAAARAALTGTLVEFAVLERRVHAVVVTRTSARLVDLGAVEPMERELAFLLAGHRRRLAGRRAGGDAAAGRLGDLLIAPLGLDADGDLVVVPAGILHDLPWAALPPLYGRRLVVAPSADLWHRRRRPHRPAGSVLLVAGPGLPGATAEVRALAGLHPGARTLTGPAATVDAVLAAFGDADLVHVAAHGHYRSDSPLFSALELADRSLTMYELESAVGAPPTVVLPACDAGRPTVLTGDELLGTTTAMLARGVRSVVAPVLPVPDRETAELMVELHRSLAAGAAPSAALAAVARAVADDPGLRPVAAAFVCVGAAETADLTPPAVPSPRPDRRAAAAAAPAVSLPGAAGG
ncbi:CHAT domain-containing tetratricopeptide repeat protein [Pseudonocardia xishanensis]|uniref:CHAT domain-containing protein n=1 Tax=Pseudonocardia xishanensis TaxID=630995 RepID=A0ABP8RND4_9PSEU